MASIADMVGELAQVSVDGNAKEKILGIAEALLAAVFYKTWEQTPESEKAHMIKDRGQELFDNYFAHINVSKMDPKEAAKQAIDQELEIIAMVEAVGSDDE